MSKVIFDSPLSCISGKYKGYIRSSDEYLGYFEIKIFNRNNLIDNYNLFENIQDAKRFLTDLLTEIS